MLDVLKIVTRQGKSSRTTWSNRFSWTVAHNISQFSNFFEFVDFFFFFFFFLLAFKGDFLCIHPVY
jgi:hypothetical protein